MSYPFDASLKDIIGQSPVDYAPMLHLPVHLPARKLNVDLSTISAATDVAFGFGEPLEEIVDINFQSGPDAYVDDRLLLYNSAYRHHYHVKVRSVLVLLRPTADHSRLSGKIAYSSGESELQYRYEIVRLWQQPVAPFLSGGLALLPLAPLCQLRQDVPLEQALREVIQQIDLRLATEAPYATAVRLMTATFILTGLRADKQVIRKLFQGVRVMHESTAFELYRDEGRLEESRRWLLRLGQKRFGSLSATVEADILAMQDLDRLERLGEALLTAQSWEELLAIS